MSEENGFESILNSKFRWPQVGDKPFTKSANRHRNATIDEYRHYRLELMIEGYKKAADLLVERAKQVRQDQDVLIFPIIFNYRHFIELSLKYLIATYGKLVNTEVNWKTHNLSEHWQTFIAVSNEYGMVDSDKSIAIAGQIVREFSTIDPNSSFFRYPVDRKGILLKINHEQIDFVRLQEVMNGLENFFNGCDGYMDNLKYASPCYDFDN